MLPQSLFAGSETFFDASKARSRRCQNPPFGLKQLASLFFHFAKIDKLVKSHFANDIEPFWEKIQNEPGVKNFKLFEGVRPSF